jgi:ABC-2 type transport system ATP-binding protein
MSGLDPIGRKMVGDLLVDLKGQGKTVFFSSHILNDIERFSDRAGIIIKGKLRMVDTLSNLLSTGKSLEDVFMRQVAIAEGGTAE